MRQLVTDLSGDPADFQRFKTRFMQLLAGEEPEDQREAVLSQSLKSVRQMLAELNSPMEVMFLSWLAFLASRRWFESTLSEFGQRTVARADKLLTDVIVTIAYDAWKSLEGIEKANGGAAKPAEGEGPVSAVPDA